MSFDTLRFEGGRLELIDQRILPGKIEYPVYDNASAIADAIRSMVVRGAPAIGCAAACGIAVEAMRLSHLESGEFLSKMEQAFSVLAKSRPTAVNLFWALDRMREAMKKGKIPSEIAATLEAEAKSIVRRDVEDNLAMGKHGAELVPEGARIVTYCNAGALATAGHGTALGVIRSARDRKISVYACETRPLLQGARLTSWELSMEKIPVTLICDSMAGYLMQKGEIDIAIVGADRVAANGDVANKIGTYTLAVLAKRHGIPFYVACPISTIDAKTPTGFEIPIEERDASEVRGYRDVEWAADVPVRNPA
ncbi:MAG: S-methyl-5-thioribose-1-phosphate isomerase, partial [Burkholderiales bacterium]|nr:S-methyl-5-thioribose-1-phosphate isomerase [Burkholderiales bacterium]